MCALVYRYCLPVQYFQTMAVAFEKKTWANRWDVEYFVRRKTFLASLFIFTWLFYSPVSSQVVRNFGFFRAHTHTHTQHKYIYKCAHNTYRHIHTNSSNNQHNFPQRFIVSFRCNISFQYFVLIFSFKIFIEAFYSTWVSCQFCVINGGLYIRKTDDPYF